MAIVFKYKNACNLSYAPGIVDAGQEGPEGKQGISGTTIHFVDYDLNNSYIIQLALQKIENNQILMNTSEVSIAERPYKENDLILSNSGNVYRIVLATKTSAQNYKFDIEFLGTLHDKPQSNIGKIIVYDITDKTINGVTYSSNSTCPIYTNRSEMLFNDDTPILSKDQELHGLWIKVAVIINTSGINSNDEENALIKDSIISELEKRYSYHLISYLRNVKNMQSLSSPVVNYKTDPSPEELLNKFTFFKKLEFTNLRVYSPQTEGFNNIVEIETSEIGVGNGLYNTYYITDLAMDKMHPSGNNIRCTLSNDEIKIWKNSSLKNDYYGDETIKELELGPNAYVSDNYVEYTKCEDTDMRFAQNFVCETSDTPVHLKYENFPDNANHAVGLSLSTLQKSSAEIAFEKCNDLGHANDIIEYSKRTVNNNSEYNYRGGESVYFSSIAEEYTVNEIKSYIENTMYNKYTLVVKDRITKEYTVCEVPIAFQTITI